MIWHLTILRIIVSTDYLKWRAMPDKNAGMYNVRHNVQRHLGQSVYKWRRCSKKKCCKLCGQVKFMDTMTKWPVQKHTEHHKTRSKQGRNRQKEITIFCVFRFFCFLFSIFNYFKDFSRKCWITALVRSMKIIGGLNQFPAAANLTLIQH